MLQVHEGMMSAATFVHCDTVEATEAAAQRFPGWHVLVTGHSNGGEGHWQSCCFLAFVLSSLHAMNCPFMPWTALIASRGLFPLGALFLHAHEEL